MRGFGVVVRSQKAKASDLTKRHKQKVLKDNFAQLQANALIGQRLCQFRRKRQQATSRAVVTQLLKTVSKNKRLRQAASRVWHLKYVNRLTQKSLQEWSGLARQKFFRRKKFGEIVEKREVARYFGRMKQHTALMRWHTQKLAVKQKLLTGKVFQSFRRAQAQTLEI